MANRRPLGLPLFTSPAATEDTEAPVARRLPVERGAQFLPPPGPETNGPANPGRRLLAAGGLTFKTSEQE